MSETPFIEAIGQAIIAASLGQDTDRTADWFVSYAFMDDSPDRMIGIFDAPGRPPEETFRLDYPDIQIRVRGKANDYQAAAAQARAIFGLLHGGETAVNTYTSPPSAAVVFLYAKNSAPLSLGVDEKRRPHVCYNFRSAKGRAIA